MMAPYAELELDAEESHADEHDFSCTWRKAYLPGQLHPAAVAIGSITISGNDDEGRQTRQDVRRSQQMFGGKTIRLLEDARFEQQGIVLTRFALGASAVSGLTVTMNIPVGDDRAETASVMTVGLLARVNLDEQGMADMLWQLVEQAP
jgi:hypothetical protein